MINKTNLRINKIYVLIVALISTMTLISATTVSNVNAADKEGPGYSCSHVPGSGTIGQVKCCAKTGDFYCTICDNTTPPSNCQPRTIGKDDSKGSDPIIIGDNVFNDGSSDGSSESENVDPDKIVGGGFNQ
jgi:hypothetical protein